MNLNSQYAYDPPQPDNPTDEERYVLARYALEQRGWPEDGKTIQRLTAPPPDITGIADPGTFKGVKVAVIGGGLAGLAAAYELRKLGFDITLYEALADRVGGRIYTYYFNHRQDLYHEFGAMRIPVTHETVWHYVNLFKLPSRPFIQYNPNAYIYLKNTRVRNDREGYNVMRYIYPKYDLNDWERKQSWRELFRLGIESHLLSATTEERAEILQVKPYYTPRAQMWGDRSNIQMMQAAGLSQEAINLVSSVQPLLKGNLYNSYIDYVQEDYPASTSYLYELPGGMVKLPLAFCHAFQEDNPYPDIPPSKIGRVSLQRGCWVEGITRLTGGKVAVSYRLDALRRSVSEAFDYVICAIPFSTLRMLKIEPLFSSIKMRAIREVNYTPSQKSLLLCRERFWEKEGIFGGGSFTDLPISSIWYPDDHMRYAESKEPQKPGTAPPWSRPGVIVGSYNFNLDTTRLTNQPQQDICAELNREIEAVHGLKPMSLDSIVQGCKTVNWEQEPTFRGALCFYTPGQKNLFSYGMALPEYDGRVFFAGEHISALHRWMQGALQSGMQAAGDLALAGRVHIGKG